jgi:hypothetical protein
MSDESTSERTNATVPANARAMLDKLHDMLDEQLKLVQQGRLADAEGMCEQTGHLVHAIVASGALAEHGGHDPRQRLLQLYRELCLTLTAQRGEVSTSLQTVRRGRQMLRTYGKHVS